MAKSKIPGYVAPPAATDEKKPPIALYVGIGALVVIALIALIVVGARSDGGAGAVTEISPVITVSGEHLPAFPQDAGAIPLEDDAIGKTVPTLTGRNFQDEEVTFEGDRAELRLFLSHSCQFCQAEVPKIVEWLDDGTIPDSVELRVITTNTNPALGNYPPSAWLNREGLEADVLLDDTSKTAATAFGLPGYPYMVAIDKDGVVVGRSSGGLDLAQLTQLVERVEAGLGGANDIDPLEDNEQGPSTDADLSEDT